MGRAAKGTLLRIGSAAATANTTVGEVRDIAGGGETVDIVDTTHQQSTVEEIHATILRTNELTLQINYNPRHATHSTGVNGLRGLLRNRTKRNFKIASPAATSTAAWDICLFPAYVTRLSPSYNMGDGLFGDVTLKPTTTLATYTTGATATG